MGPNNIPRLCPIVKKAHDRAHGMCLVPIITVIAIIDGIAIPPPIPKKVLAKKRPQKECTITNEKIAPPVTKPPIAKSILLLNLSARRPIGVCNRPVVSTPTMSRIPIIELDR